LFDLNDYGWSELESTEFSVEPCPQAQKERGNLKLATNVAFWLCAVGSYKIKTIIIVSG
jgi:hypothetical protein